MPDDLRWSWCNNRNKVHIKCNALESSWNHPPLQSMKKIVFHETNLWYQKGRGLLSEGPAQEPKSKWHQQDLAKDLLWMRAFPFHARGCFHRVASTDSLEIWFYFGLIWSIFWVFSNKVFGTDAIHSYPEAIVLIPFCLFAFLTYVRDGREEEISVTGYKSQQEDQAQSKNRLSH